ncbi:MAG: hypothetical protein EBQ89_00035, partial [Alphaproteobacteria bacterium]|nr:hypothetical protein [Alphaproteobacteria bacterium]
MRYRSLRRVGAPTVEPVSLAEAKAHCRVDIGTDDALIAGYISAARELCEDYLDRSLVTQQYVMRLDQFPPEIELPRPPVVSSGTATAVAVTYTLNDSGATAALATTQYRVDRDSTPGAIRNLYGGTWPSNRDDQNSISVTWWAGYGNPESVPQRVKNAILMTVL